MKAMDHTAPLARGLALISTPRGVAAALLAVGAGALATAYIAEYGFGLEPCVLCLYQRIPYAVVGVLGLVGLIIAPDRRRAGWLAAAAGAAFLIGSGIAVYHVGVEQHWWQSATGCGGGLPPAMDVKDLMASLSAPLPKACDAVDWTFLGLSMATWNAAVSPLLAAASAWAAHGFLAARP